MFDNLNETERGNNAFSNEEGSTVIFVELEPIAYSNSFRFLQAAYTPMNYPAWDVSTVEMTKEKLADHVTYTLGGWNANKCNLPAVNLTGDGYVMDNTDIAEDVVDHAINQAHSSDYDPTKTKGMVSSGIRDSAAALNYELTTKLHEECCDLFYEKFDNSTIS